MLEKKTQDMFLEVVRNPTALLQTRWGPRTLTRREQLIIGFLATGRSYEEVGQHFDVIASRVKDIANKVRRSILYTKRLQEQRTS